MESTPKKAPRSKFPALLVVALALVALGFRYLARRQCAIN